MEKALHRHYYIRRSPLFPNQNQHQAQIQQHGAARFPMRLSILQQITSSNRIISPLNQSSLHPKSFSVQHTIVKMADQSKSTSSDKSSLLDAIVDKPEAEKPPEDSPPLPEPPEKPLPGDCCGSGCVRCVWDIYYEELEEYNKLCKSKSDSLSNLKPS